MKERYVIRVLHLYGVYKLYTKFKFFCLGMYI